MAGGDHLPIQKSTKNPLNSSDWDFSFVRSKLDTRGVKLNTALSCAFDEERYGRTRIVPSLVGITFSPVLDSVISTVSPGFVGNAGC